MFVACGIWCLADVSSVRPSSEQTLETSAKHHIPQATNIPHQPLLRINVGANDSFPYSSFHPKKFLFIISDYGDQLDKVTA